jgi:hypothetical protein
MNTLVSASFARQDTKAQGAAPRRSRLTSRRDARREYLLVSAIAFMIFMVVVLFARLLPRARRARLLGACADGNIVAQARAMAAMSIPFAFMG